MQFLDILVQHCQTTPDKIAIEFITGDDWQTVTYAQMEQTVQRTMRYLLALGVEAGNRVALQLPKGLPFIYLHLAIMRLGAISLPLNPAFPIPELLYFLSDSEAKLYFGDESAASDVQTIHHDLPALQAMIFLAEDTQWESALDTVNLSAADLPESPADSNMTALMIYTSGTTGRPKGAELTHGNLTANLNALHTAWGWRSDDVLLHVLPIFHTHGLTVALHGALNAGATAVLLPKFDPQQVLDLLVDQERGFSVFMAVPTIHHRLLAVPDAASYDLSHMRLMTSGSARLADDVFKAFQQTFNYTLLERYGMTETGMNLSNPYEGERRIGSVGLPLPDVEARVVDPAIGEPLPDGKIGEVQIRGPHVFKGYWRQPEKTAQSFTADGWLKTGDMGLRDPDGYFTLKGRAKDLIISGGMNIYPPEVELVLADHPSVAASAVIGCLDDEWGERVVAVIVARDGTQPDAEGIISYCRQHLAAYKTPRTIIFVDDFPRNAMGKVQKAKLREGLC